MTTDTVVYETTRDTPYYVIQFESENGNWIDSRDPDFRSLKAARSHLDAQPRAPYPYRIVERRG